MLNQWTEQELEQYAPWAYQLAMEPARSSYPTYRDGIKTWEDFVSRSKRTDRDEEGLLFRHRGQVHGWMEWYAIAGENCACTVSFLVDAYQDEAAKEFVERVREKLPGGTLDVGMDAANVEACQALERAGFRCIEQAENHTLFFADYHPQPTPEGVSMMTTADEADFRRLHDYPEMYWNADRVLADPSAWRIYMLRRGGRMVGALLCSNDDWPEIFSIDFENHQFDPDVYRPLLCACLNDLKASAAQHMTYFTEEEKELPILAELGFLRVGGYRAYRKTF